MLAATATKRQASKLPALLDTAASLFADRGYHATTIRDIAQGSGVTPGAVYFHVPTKQALLVAVYEEGVDRIIRHLDQSLGCETDRHERFRRAVRAHLESILDESAYARVIVRVLPDDVPEASSELKMLRERYEGQFRLLIADLPLPKHRNRKLTRLLLIGALNWTPVWYSRRAGNLDQIVSEFMAAFGETPTRKKGKA